MTMACHMQRRQQVTIATYTKDLFQKWSSHGVASILNPIENLWSIIKRKVYVSEPQFQRKRCYVMPYPKLGTTFL